MSLTDKEIALELTKAYLGHLNARATSDQISGSHSKAENVAKMYQLFYSTASKSEKTTFED